MGIFNAETQRRGDAEEGEGEVERQVGRGFRFIDINLLFQHKDTKTQRHKEL